MTQDELLARILGDNRIALRVSRAAKLLDFGRTHLYEMVKRGEIKAVTIGGQQRIPVTEVLRLINVAVPAESEKS